MSVLQQVVGRRSWDRRNVLLGTVAVAASIALGAVLAGAPFLAAGIAVGTLFVTFLLFRPLLAIGILLALGPLDLSFATGGFKSLLPELGGVDMNGIRLVGVIVGLILLALTDRRVGRRIFERDARWFVLFLLFAGATIPGSLAPMEGLRLLFKIGYPLLLYVTVLGVAEEARDVERLVDYSLVGAVILVMIVNPLSILGGSHYEVDRYGFIRIMGLTGHFNPFSFYLLVMLLLAFMRYRSRQQLRYLVLAGIFAAWLVLTVTRIAFLAGTVALGSMAVFGAYMRRDWRTLAWAVGIGVVIAILFVPPVLERTFYGRIPTIPEVIALIRDPVRLYQSINMEGRQALWAVLAASFMTSPIFGLGLGSSTEILTESTGGFILVAHNEYLRLLVDVGIIGSVLFAIAIIRWFLEVLTVARAESRLARELALPALASLLAWAVISLTDNPLDYYSPFTQFVAVICAGAIVGGRLSVSRADEEEEEEDGDTAVLEAVSG